MNTNFFKFSFSLLLLFFMFSCTTDGKTVPEPEDPTPDPNPEEVIPGDPTPDPEDPAPDPGPTTVALANVFGENMVLQQQTDAAIWGTAKANVNVSVTPSWNGQKYTVKSDSEGNWRLKVATPAASNTPYSITIYDGTQITVNNVYIGEVWICSGQSNMAWTLEQTNHKNLAQSSAQYTTLKILSIEAPDEGTTTPQDFRGITGWQSVSPTTTPPFGAIAYMFGVKLNQKLNIPVGMINTARGGMPIQQFLTNEAVVKEFGASHTIKNIQGTYNTRITPVRGYTARGFLWYQGESNRLQLGLYPRLFKTLVNLWRDKDHWDNATMPFYIVQIAPWAPDGNLTGVEVPMFVEVQVNCRKNNSNVWIASTTDVGDANLIHPKTKEPVAERLYWLALRNSYKITDNVPLESPLYKSYTINGDKIVVSFDNIAKPDNIFASNGEITGFEIAGVDQVFVEAKATITDDGTTITVSSPNVPSPRAVRYAFRNYKNPPGNLKTKAGQPVPCFRTDNW